MISILLYRLERLRIVIKSPIRSRFSFRLVAHQYELNPRYRFINPLFPSPTPPFMHSCIRNAAFSRSLVFPIRSSPFQCLNLSPVFSRVLFIFERKVIPFKIILCQITHVSKKRWSSIGFLFDIPS